MSPPHSSCGKRDRVSQTHGLAALIPETYVGPRVLTCHHTPQEPQESPPKFVTVSAAQVPGKCGMSVGARHPNRAPLWPLPFRPGNHSGPTSRSWLHGKYRGGGGGSPAHQLTSPTSFSPLSRHECNISVLAVTREAAPEGLLAAGQAEWRRCARRQGAEWGQPRRNSERPRPFASPGTQRRNSPFSRPSR